MLKNVTRSRLIQVWFAVVALVVAGSIAVGVSVTSGTAVMLLAAALVPPVILLLLRPGDQPQTVAQLLHEADSTRAK